MKSEKSVKTAYNEILSYYSCDLGMGEGSRRILSGGGNFPIATGRTSKGKEELWQWMPTVNAKQNSGEEPQNGITV